MFISIGSECDVKFNIDKYTGSKPTFFFDWLKTDMASVNKIMGTENIEEILFFDNIIKSPIYADRKETTTLILKSLSKCESMHDVPYTYNDSDIYEFIEKYKRRYYRIINCIKNLTSEIYFVRKGQISNSEKDTFISSILKINPNCKFKLIELLEQKIKNKHYIHEKFFISLNLDNYRIKNTSTDWTHDCWEWKKILYFIYEDK